MERKRIQSEQQATEPAGLREYLREELGLVGGEEFAYKGKNGWALMTFDNAMDLCGGYMGNASRESLVQTFRDFQAKGENLKTAPEQYVQRSRALGREAKNRAGK